MARSENMNRPLLGILMGKVMGEGRVEVWTSFEVRTDSENDPQAQENALIAREQQCK